MARRGTSFPAKILKADLKNTVLGLSFSITRQEGRVTEDSDAHLAVFLQNSSGLLSGYVLEVC